MRRKVTILEYTVKGHEITVKGIIAHARVEHTFIALAGSRAAGLLDVVEMLLDSQMQLALDPAEDGEAARNMRKWEAEPG